ncbi:MAG: FAD-binding protein [Phenylobacterium sp.]|uniref:D-arabinono-1,4-lactone oxidase n=1 Tax=Phenylobacterium sp. TaxID=1871053 RepID=UPI0025D888F2|nr:D-arabinono-1,4-lactone oxidase [Phenylobacterium sp.]MBI1199767.1 FAD-binding protein [Phenylobacterium sp.]
MTGWSNWSGSVRSTPTQMARPQTEAELSRLVAEAAKVRVVGAGHSFMPLCETDGLLLNLEDLDSPIEVAPDRKTVTAPAGWSLKKLTAALWDLGLSLPNQGDVNPQSLAGALATGTHGTGKDLGSLATFAHGFRLVQADGSAVECSRTENPELFEAQRLSLGLFGVATRITVDVLPAYRLEERIEKKPLAWTLEAFPEFAAQRRHAEFFVFPYADTVILKTLEPTDLPGDPGSGTDISEAPFRVACQIGQALPALIGPLQRLMMQLSTGGGRVGPAHLIFPSERTIRFEEMEYELPREAGLPALSEVIGWIRRKRLPVAFPFEFRWAAGDDIWMSPFNLGPGASISMHQYAPMAWRALFAEAEAIFRSHGGRPHWAKRHTLTRTDVDALYPMAERFRRVRRTADPGGKFLNPHLAELFS